MGASKAQVARTTDLVGRVFDAYYGADDTLWSEPAIARHLGISGAYVHHLLRDSHSKVVARARAAWKDANFDVEPEFDLDGNEIESLTEVEWQAEVEAIAAEAKAHLKRYGMTKWERALQAHREAMVAAIGLEAVETQEAAAKVRGAMLDAASISTWGDDWDWTKKAARRPMGPAYREPKVPPSEWAKQMAQRRAEARGRRAYLAGLDEVARGAP